MKLISARIKGYRNVMDTRDFQIENVSCLIGRNVKGKSTVLETLTKLNSADCFSEGITDESDIAQSLSVLDSRFEHIVSTKWELSAEELEELRDTFGFAPLTTGSVVISKGYSNQLKWDLPLCEKIPTRTWLASPLQRKIALHSQLTPRNRKPAYFPPDELVRHASVSNEFFTHLKDFSIETMIQDALTPQLPHFLYFSKDDLISKKTSISEMLASYHRSCLTTSEKIFVALTELAGIPMEQMSSSAEPEKLAAQLSVVGNAILADIPTFFSHYAGVSIEFRVQKSPRFSLFRKKDHIFYCLLNFSNSSLKEKQHAHAAGLLWLFSLLIIFARAQIKYRNKLIVVLDQPQGNFAYMDDPSLFAFLKEKVSRKHQLIYSSNSLAVPEASFFRQDS